MPREISSKDLKNSAEQMVREKFVECGMQLGFVFAHKPWGA